MAKFQTVPLEQLKATAGLSPQKLKALEKYKGYLQKLDSKTGGVLTCERGEDIRTVRGNLKRAAKLQGIDITIKSSDNTLSFYLKEKRARRGRPRKK